MLATNVSGEFILPRDASGPYKVTCLSPTGLPVKIFHREKVNPEPSAVVTRIRREALFSCIGRLVILSLVQRGRSSKSWRSWVKSGAFYIGGDSERSWSMTHGSKWMVIPKMTHSAQSAHFRLDPPFSISPMVGWSRQIENKAYKGEIDDIRTTISSLTIFPYGDDRVEMPQWEEMNATTSCDWIIENSMHSKMTWKMHRSKKYKYQDMVPIFRVPELPSWPLMASKEHFFAVSHIEIQRMRAMKYL